MNIEQQKEEIKPTSTNTDMNLHTLTFKAIGTLQEIEWYEEQLAKIGNPDYKKSIIGLIDEMISRDMKLSEIFDDDANWAKKQFGEYHSKVNAALTELKQRIEEL